MAMRSTVLLSSVRRSLMEGTRSSGTSGLRYFSDGSGRVLSEEERAAENVYIRKMERERAEKLKLKQQKEKAALEKEEKKPEGSQKA